MNEEMHVVRVLNLADDPKVDWHYAITDITTAENAED